MGRPFENWKTQFIVAQVREQGTKKILQAMRGEAGKVNGHRSTLNFACRSGTVTLKNHVIPVLGLLIGASCSKEVH